MLTCQIKNAQNLAQRVLLNVCCRSGSLEREANHPSRLIERLLPNNVPCRQNQNHRPAVYQLRIAALISAEKLACDEESSDGCSLPAIIVSALQEHLLGSYFSSNACLRRMVADALGFAQVNGKWQVPGLTCSSMLCKQEVKSLGRNIPH